MIIVHILILIATACMIVYADHMGWTYMRGTAQTLSAKKVEFLHWGVWVGLMGMVSSGFFLAYDRFPYLISNPAFVIKLVFVGVLIVNAIFIGSLSRLAITVPYSSLTARQKMILTLSAGASTISWLGAAAIGLFFL